MEKIGDVIKAGSYKKPIQKRVFNCKITADEFKELFLDNAKGHIHATSPSFEVDENNKEIINQMFYYLIGSEKFNGDLIKGILLIGAIGSGKTVLMDSFLDVFNERSGKVVWFLNSKDLTSEEVAKDLANLSKRPLSIDDIGKEQTSINTYGTVSRPMEDLINDRYKTGGLTFGTSNLKMEEMPYIKHTVDRMGQMFNVMILPGKTRRQS